MQILSGRRHRVETLVFSHCGRWLAAVGFRRGVHIWDTANPTRKPQNPADLLVLNAAFTADGRLFFSDTLGKCYLLDPATLARAPAGMVKSGFGRLALTSDCAQFAQVNYTAVISMWKVGAKGEITTRKEIKSASAGVRWAAFSPNGESLATIEFGGSDANIVIRSTKTLKQTGAAECYAAAQMLVFSLDSSRVVVPSGASIAVYDTSNLETKPRKATNPSRRHFLSMAFHPDGQLLTVDNDRLVQIWDVNTMTVTRSVEWKIGKLYAVTVSPDGTRAAVGSHTGKVLVWDWD
ncbi:MAG: hypothetical protein C0467_19520 [Planctomycetaceae bacterium]|nr:hypothetical protein [Planctomycetaceae bacterium]